MKDDCIFCKLANGVFDTNTLYEDDDFRVIFDAAPATVGHVLILPKEHYANVFEMPEELIGKAYKLAQNVAKVLDEITDCEGINILQNNGEMAGQTIFHFHIHVIPRYNKSDMLMWKTQEPDQEAIDSIINKAQELF